VCHAHSDEDCGCGVSWTAPGEGGGQKPTLKTNMMLGKKRFSIGNRYIFISWWIFQPVVMLVSFFLGPVYFLEFCFCGEDYDFVTNYILYVIIYLIYVYCIYIYM